VIVSPLAEFLDKDLVEYVSYMNEENHKRINTTLTMIAAILYLGMAIEYHLRGFVLPLRMEKVCLKCKRWSQDVNDTGTQKQVCPRCQEKSNVTFKKLSAEVRIMEKKNLGKSDRMITLARGSTIPEVNGEFGTFALMKGYTIYRQKGLHPTYENSKGDVVYLGPIKDKHGEVK
jgi:hypothetical protein